MIQVKMRHEPATEAGEPEGSDATPEQTCVWVVDGETTTATAYLKAGEAVTINVAAQAEMGIVGPISTEPPA